jgi:hypothetical protein
MHQNTCHPIYLLHEQPRFYGGSEAAMIQALYALRLSGTRFLVAGRKNEASGDFETLSSIATTIPTLLIDMFIEIPEAEFRADLSSTAIRAAMRPSS